MANRRAMKLFAVAILAGTSTAYAETETQSIRSYGYGAPQPRVDWSGKIDIMAIKPRVLANGRAAPGNTPGKKAYGMADVDEVAPTAEQQNLLTASLAYQAALEEPLVINPRLLGNARPACGNTGGKAEPPADCTQKEIRAATAYDREYERVSTLRSLKIAGASTKLMAATEAAVRADPSLRARLLISGRPACGNTMGKSSPPSYCQVGDE